MARVRIGGGGENPLAFDQCVSVDGREIAPATPYRRSHPRQNTVEGFGDCGLPLHGGENSIEMRTRRLPLIGPIGQTNITTLYQVCMYRVHQDFFHWSSQYRICTGTGTGGSGIQYLRDSHLLLLHARKYLHKKQRSGACHGQSVLISINCPGSPSGLPAVGKLCSLSAVLPVL